MIDNTQILEQVATRQPVFPTRPHNLLDLPSIHVAGFINSASENERALLLGLHDCEVYVLQVRAECSHLFAEYQDAISSLSTRLFDLEARPMPEKGDKGDKGDPGADSTIPGPQGKDSTISGPKGDKGDPGASFTWRGEYKKGRVYQPLDCVSHDGGSFVCVKETKSEPSQDNPAWNALALQGERGPAGKHGESWTYWRGSSAAPATTTTGDSREIVLPSAETVAPGLPVTVASNTIRRASPATRESAQVLGLAKATTTAGLCAQLDGVFEQSIEAWSAAGVVGGLTPNMAYVLTESGLGTIAPAHGFATFLGWAISETALRLSIGPPTKLS